MKYLTTPLSILAGLAGIIALLPALPFVALGTLCLFIAGAIQKLGNSFHGK